MFDIIFKEVKKISVTLAVIDIIIVIITLAGGWFDFSIICGMLYGFVFCELMFILLGTIVDKALTMDETRAKRHMRINYIVRYLLTGVILTIPFLFEQINEWCVVAAMLSPKFTYFAIGFYDSAKTLKGGK